MRGLRQSANSVFLGVLSGVALGIWMPNAQAVSDTSGGIIDCNGNGVDDYLDIQNETSSDCNLNGRPDECDLNSLPRSVAGGILANDCNFNSIPDDCELFENDCNANGYPDDCDIRGGGRLLFADFENGLPIGWSLEGATSITSACQEDPVCDGGSWAYMGSPSNCSTGGAANAALVSPVFQTDFPLSALRFCGRLGDVGVGGWARIQYSCQLASGQEYPNFIVDQEWHEYELDMGGQFAARGPCVLRFQLQSLEDFFGWQIDAIELVSGSADVDQDGLPDECTADCNQNDVSDIIDISSGTSNDCNNNLTPDECELAGNDCNNNGRPDECDLYSLPRTVAGGGGGGVPANDCNSNGIPDDCDIAENPYLDCNVNFVLDPCEVASGVESDCNGNNFLDQCDIEFGVSPDCNLNGVPDSCDLAATDAAELCQGARSVCPGVTYSGTTAGANNDGSADCGSSAASPDMWFSYVPRADGEASVSLCGSQYDTVLSVHDSCPGPNSQEIACDDDSCPLGPHSTVTFNAVVGKTYVIRVSGYNGAAGEFSLSLTGPACDAAADCNVDGVPDSCQLTNNDSNSNGVPDDCESFATGDFTGDGAVNLDDLPLAVECLEGPGVSTSQSCVSGGDFDGDGDIDLHDMSGMFLSFE